MAQSNRQMVQSCSTSLFLAWQGIGLGSALVSDALRRCLAASDIAGVRAVIVHAIDDGAVEFYQRLGFIPSPLGPRVLIMPIETVRGVTRGLG